MLLKFAKLNPCENMTILVLDPVPREYQAEVAEELMAYGNVHAEQVGFLETPASPEARARLQMMGGEFCGNASMCLGAWLSMQDGLPGDRTEGYLLEVSGAEKPVLCRVSHFRSRYSCSVRMPLPNEVREVEFPDGIRCPVVFFSGIAHAIVPVGLLNQAQAEARIRDWCEFCGAEAFGVILQEASEDFDCAIRPLVYVASTRSSVWERGCGSGTAALGACRAWHSGGVVHVNVEQPGGSIAVNAECTAGAITKLEISGTVYPACAGEAWIECNW